VDEFRAANWTLFQEVSRVGLMEVETQEVNRWERSITYWAEPHNGQVLGQNLEKY
jgi:hypothetical protein